MSENNTNTTTTTTATTANKPAPVIAFDNAEMLQKWFDEIRAKYPADFVAQQKHIEAYAKEFSGEDNSEARRKMFATVLDADLEKVLKTKAGVPALATALYSKMTNSQTSFDAVKANVLAKDKEEKASEPKTTEAETMALELQAQLADETAIEVSETLRALSPENIARIMAVSYAATIAFFRQLSTKENPFPDSAKNFINFLIAASHGDAFKKMFFTDKNLAYKAEISEKTIQRARKDLRQFMASTGKGIVTIETEYVKDKDGKDTAKPRGYVYSIPFLATVAQQITNLFNSDKGEADNVLLATTIGQALALPEAERGKLNLTPEAEQTVKAMTENFKAMIEAIEPPNEEVRKGEVARQLQIVLDKYAPIREEMDALKQSAIALKKPKLAQNIEMALQAVRAKFNEVEDKGIEYHNETTFEGFQNELNEYRTKVKHFLEKDAEKAQEATSAERETEGQATPETLRTMAEKNAAVSVSNGTLKDDYEQSLIDFEELVFNLSELAKAGKVKVTQIVPTLHAYIADAFELKDAKERAEGEKDATPEADNATA